MLIRVVRRGRVAGGVALGRCFLSNSRRRRNAGARREGPRRRAHFRLSRRI